MIKHFTSVEKVLYENSNGETLVLINDEIMLYARWFYYWIYLNQSYANVSISINMFPVKNGTVLEYEPIRSETINLNNVPMNSPILYLLDLTICQKYVLDRFALKFEITSPLGAKIIKITRTTK